MIYFQDISRILLCIMISTMLPFIGCKELSIHLQDQKSDEPGIEETVDIDPVITPFSEDVPLGITEFGFNLFDAIWETEQNQNIFISPLSVSIALTMTLNGASGETEQAMTDTLQLQDIDRDSINSTYQQLQEKLKTDDTKVALTIANSLWGHQEIQFIPTFLQQNTHYFNAEISSLDFSDPTTLSIINQWVSYNTDGKIPKILDRIASNEVLFLINAVYFKGAWQNEFDPSQTKDGKFYLSSGNEKTVPMMSRTGNYEVFSGENFQAINLPYGEGEISMYVFLPSKESDLNELLDGINIDSWEEWLSDFRVRNVRLQIPKFKIEYGTKELNDALTALGMGIAFDADNADFSRMAELERIGGNLYITKVSHKTFIEVNEEGTEAAAATSVGVGIKSLPPPFIVDRPFFFTIRDNETKTVIFMGTMTEP
ncbi:proteinase inhibitor I4 serpin [Candidatus Poribacteria bacterium]|nr:MAG: proteinase inhibitor I4 serpin [Candidatus Poribacteria bacterium]